MMKPSYDTIVAAVSGDTQAMWKIVKCYEPYINRLSLHDDVRTGRPAIDIEVKNILIAKLISKILEFKLE